MKDREDGTCGWYQCQISPPVHTSSLSQALPRLVVITAVATAHTYSHRKAQLFSRIHLTAKQISFTGWYFKTIMPTVRLNSHCTPSSLETLTGKHMRSLIFGHIDQQFFTAGAEWQFAAFRSVSEARPLLPKFNIGFRAQTCSMFAAEHRPSQQHQYLGFLHPLWIQHQEGNTEQVAQCLSGIWEPLLSMLETAPWL